MSSNPPQPLQLVSNPNESYQVDIVVCAGITWSIGLVFVALRFLTRGYLLQNVLGMEDWFILVALVFSGATSAGMIEQAIDGLGKHILDVDTTLMRPMARAGWYTILWYLLALLFTKISILLLYIRILSSYQHARYAAYAIMGIVILANGIWTLATVVTACVPLTAFWEEGGRLTPGVYCHSLQIWFGNTGLHIGTDVLLYVLPLPMIVNLRIRARQKVFLYSIFGLGFLVCAVSVVRLWDLIQENKRPDFTYDNVSIAYLTCIEVNAAIACACCMTLKPLMVRMFPRLWGSHSDSAGAPRKNNKDDLEAAAPGAKVDDSGTGAGPGSNERGPPTIGSKPSRRIEGGRARGIMGRNLWGSSTWPSDTSPAITHHNAGSGDLQKLGTDMDDDRSTCTSSCATRRSNSVEKGELGSSYTGRKSEDGYLCRLSSHVEDILKMPESPEAAKLRGEATRV